MSDSETEFKEPPVELAVSKPDQEMDLTDNGDDTLRRFRFQITYAAVISLILLSEPTEAQEIFCEQFEDILIRQANGKYIGVQVKTKAPELGPFETTDPAIESTIIRFAKLDKRYPGQFARFTIASNASFAKRNDFRDLKYLINGIPQDLTSEADKDKIKKANWIKKIAKEASCTERELCDTLMKIKLKPDIASLDNIFDVLVLHLSQIERLSNQTFGVLEALANQLVMKLFYASSLKYKIPLVDFFLGSNDPASEDIRNRLAAKKIRAIDVQSLIDRATEDPVSLFLQRGNELAEIPKGNRLLELKMDRGGISYENINLHKDYKYSAEMQIATWVHKHSEKRAKQQYDQVKLIVNTECQEAFDETRRDNGLFGKEMLQTVRARLRLRQQNEHDSFFDCKYEHLMGVSAILTEECRIWWSTRFKI